MADDSVSIFGGGNFRVPRGFGDLHAADLLTADPARAAGLGAAAISGYPGNSAQEATRQPRGFRDRVLAAFQAPANIAYLRGLFAQRVPAGALRAYATQTLDDAVRAWAAGGGRARDVLASDPVARRGALRPAVGLWDEVKRLNRAFYEERLAVLRDHARMIEAGPGRRPGPAPDDALDGDEEPYHIRMFTADSLRPPGLEHLNDGPLWEIRENQTARGGGDGDDEPHFYGDEDAPWRAGDGSRSAEESLHEFYGDGAVASETTLGAPEQGGLTYGGEYGWGDGWRENGGTRSQRRPTIPFWQRLSREGADADIGETLGLGSHELDSHVRRWDMDRIREPRGQEYRRYGAR